MTIDNVNNVASPVSPISPLNPNSVVNQQVTLAPAIQPEPVIVQDMTALTTTETTTTSVATVKSEVSGTTSAPSPVTSTTTTSAIVKAPEVPKNKELVPGFGIVMSMQILNSGYNLQQTQIEEYIKFEQEQEYGREQELLFNLVIANDTGDRFDSINRARWRRLLGDQLLQRYGFSD